MEREPGLDRQEPWEEAARNAREKARFVAEETRERAREFGHAAEQKADNFTDTVAEKLQGAASKLHNEADRLPGGQKVADFARTAGDKMGSAASYLREHDAKDMLGDLDRVVRRHPGPSLLCAAALGFLIGMAFRHEES
jgi:ElaB/YqjD/DUF883 family membrane-anchored ribosome-binding protein